MPDAASRALRAISGPTRMRTIRYLAEHPDSTAPAIIRGTGAAAVHAALGELEDLGFVRADIPAGERHGRTVRYQLDGARLRGAVDDLHAWLRHLLP
jgi:DNA-binding transcriptional ArsR family regulator